MHETLAAAAAAAATTLLLLALNATRMLDALACVKFYLAQGCLP